MTPSSDSPQTPGPSAAQGGEDVDGAGPDVTGPDGRGPVGRGRPEGALSEEDVRAEDAPGYDGADEGEGWSTAPLPVPSSLPEGAVPDDRPPRRSDRGRLTSARSKARKAAVELLYEAEQRTMNAGDLVTRRLASPTTQTPLREYTVACVRGVVEHWTEIDETLETYSRGWRLQRMPAVDRAILRVGAWEILHNPDVPGGVAVSEAVVLATVLSTDDSPSFVNGLLSRIAETATRA